MNWPRLLFLFLMANGLSFASIALGYPPANEEVKIFQREVESDPNDVPERYIFLKDALLSQRRQEWIDQQENTFQSTEQSGEAASAGAGMTVLNVRVSTNDIAGFPLTHRSYNGRLTGPVIIARPGETLEILLNNKLSVRPNDHPADVNVPHGFNDTNLHTHGLHVSPLGEEDNVLEIVKPQAHRRYRYRIPENHPPGTHWYHAHKHGAVGLQLASGMSGPLIIEGGLDFAGFMNEIDDRILMIQQYVFSESSSGLFEVTEGDVYGQSDPTRVNNLTAINGVVAPTIRMRPGQIERWRVVHAGINTSLNLRITHHDLYEIAADGITFGYRDTKTKIEMHPGNRSDFLVQASSTPGTYYLINQVDDPENAIRGLAVPRTFLAKLIVEGELMSTVLPTNAQLAPYLKYEAIPDADITGRREILLESGRDGRFRLGGKLYEETVRNFRVRINDVEEWNLRAIRGQHPFHIHVNPFQVNKANPNGGSSLVRWQDVILIPAGKSRRIRMRFKQFEGPLVMHCHILDHEDKGMMGIAEIDPTNAPREHERDGFGRYVVPRTYHLDSHGSTRQRIEDSHIDGIPSGFRSLALTQLNIPKDQTKDRAILFVFHKGIHCIYCMKQLANIATKSKQLEKLDVLPIAICPSLPKPEKLADMKQSLGIMFPMVVDKNQTLSRAIRCLEPNGEQAHGLVLVNKNGEPLFKAFSEHAVTDVNRIVDECRVQMKKR